MNLVDVERLCEIAEVEFSDVRDKVGNLPESFR